MALKKINSTDDLTILNANLNAKYQIIRTYENINYGFYDILTPFNAFNIRERKEGKESKNHCSILYV